jgi:hypothetical protein
VAAELVDVSAEVAPQLTDTERNRLADLEATISTGLQTFVEVGSALAEVRDSRLYRVDWDTFENYCDARWGLERSAAYRYIDAAVVVSAIADAGAEVLPANVGQTRALAAVPELERPKVWARAVEDTNGKPTAAAVTQAAQSFRVASEPGGLREQLHPLRWSSACDDLAVRLKDGETVVLSYRTDQELIDWAEAHDLLVRIDRRTDWGNPFEMPADGDRDQVILAYAKHYLPNKPSLLARLPELRGKVLACWCAPEACHGDVLAWRAEQ